MAKQYRVTPAIRFFNTLAKAALRLGLAPKRSRILETRGRHSGLPRRTPISVLHDGDGLYLVSPYGETDWARNARLGGSVTLRRSGTAIDYQVEELDARQAAPRLKRYLEAEPTTRSYFDVSPASPLTDFAAEAHRHPVFRLIAKP